VKWTPRLMNYRHAFHAGNFADVHKHAVLAWILTFLRQKPAPIRVIDTHAGQGRYDLFSRDACRSGEWREGIGLVWKLRAQRLAPHEFLAPYLNVVSEFNPGGELRVYPGSPLICATLLRPQDRLIACELEPRAAIMLAAALRGERRAKVVAIDGWTALGAYVPPKERRGLVLVDPPLKTRTNSIACRTGWLPPIANGRAEFTWRGTRSRSRNSRMRWYGKCAGLQVRSCCEVS